MRTRSNYWRLIQGLRSMQVISKMLRSKFAIKNEELPKLDALVQEMFAEFAALSGVKQELKIAE